MSISHIAEDVSQLLTSATEYEKLGLGIAISLLIALANAWLSSIFRARTYSRIGKRKATADLHQEFNSELMTKHRHNADLILKNYCDTAIENLEDVIQEREKIPEETAWEKAIPVFVLMRFYQRISALQQDGALRSEVLFDLFGETFAWWFVLYFDKGCKDWSSAHRDLAWLNEWMTRHASSREPLWKFWKWRRLLNRRSDSDRRIQELERWRIKASEERIRRLERIKCQRSCQPQNQEGERGKNDG
ncbi:hypothetical protein [Rhizobium sp. FKY42]|uniref:hypothetical protein n=1 Tax=Rhizobium sp. FKY42 TaxID=2562310 RepID=UPI0010C0DA5A|nr:hypothetical protein [Rhizobium sp. FKY42]